MLQCLFEESFHCYQEYKQGIFTWHAFSPSGITYLSTYQ